jgi:hypothetical protein
MGCRASYGVPSRLIKTISSSFKSEKSTTQLFNDFRSPVGTVQFSSRSRRSGFKRNITHKRLVAISGNGMTTVDWRRIERVLSTPSLAIPPTTCRRVRGDPAAHTKTRVRHCRWRGQATHDTGERERVRGELTIRKNLKTNIINEIR